MLPMPYRASFLKTILLAGAAALVCLALTCAARFLPTGWASIAAALFGAAAVVAGLVAVGGLVCLYRATRQDARMPDLFYVWTQPSTTFERLRRLYRPLFGRRLRAGDVVRVRSHAEILRTLDRRGMLNNLPFMPEMLRYCGRTLRVHRRIDKINDMITKTG